METILSDLSEKAQGGETLSNADISAACAALLDEGGDVSLRADFLAALNGRGERAEEVASFAFELLGRAVSFPLTGSGAIDVCGTGGDRAGFFNISTAVMFVAAGAGARVAKHGNRGITSRSGGADALESLGVRIDLPPESAAAALDEVGCCFLFAPNYHPAVRSVAPVRKLLAERGSPSVFNLLGPLLNPARPDFQLVGVYDPRALGLYASALKAIGRVRAWAVQGEGPGDLKIDEVSTLGATSVHEVHGDTIRSFSFEASALGLPMDRMDDLQGGDAAHNAEIILGILEGRLHGAPRNIVLANAAAALVVCGIAEDLFVGLAKAVESLDSGNAHKKLRQLREKSA